MKKYDIFISYRRSSYDTANLIATRLRSAGYSVFFDMETLRSGKFNEQLYDVIDNCKDFIVVLPPNALDRCVNEDDWVRLEVLRAMAQNKNIIPVMLNGFLWPDPMPNGLEELRNYQALTASSVEYFDLAMERLQKRYLLSKPQLPIMKFIRFILISIAGLLALFLILYSVFTFLSKDVCVKYATAIAMDAGYVHTIVEENHKLAQDWEKFDNALNYETKAERVSVLQENMLQRIDLVEKNISTYWNVDSVKMDIGTYQGFLLSLNGINVEEISISPVFATLFYNDYLQQLDVLRMAVINPDTFNRRFANVVLDVFEHTVNSYYVSIISELSEFPEGSIVTYQELMKNWIYFPIRSYKLGEDREYYEMIIDTEGKLAEEAISRYEHSLEIQDAQLEDVLKKNDELEEQVSEFIESTQVNAIESDNEAELAIRREKIEAKKIEIEAQKAALEELDKQYLETYQSLKEKCAIEESDDQWYKWGKICLWAEFLSKISKSRENLLSMGVYSTSSITPDVAYADMNSLLSVYQSYHSESVDYVVPVKQFYKEVSKGKRECKGVVIFAFMEGTEHPYLQVGDIVTEYNGKMIENYEDFVGLYKENNSAEVVFIRLVDGKFVEFKERLTQSDIVGFLNLRK